MNYNNYNNYNYYTQQQQIYQQSQQQQIYQQPQQHLQYQQQQQYQQYPQQQQQLINFIHNSGVEIYCDAPSFSDEYNINNLITQNNNNGFLASSFMKTPIDITISLPYPIDLERIGILSKVGTCVSQSMSIFISEYSMKDLIEKTTSNVATPTPLSLSQGSVFSPPSSASPSSSHLGVHSNTDLSVERYPGARPSSVNYGSNNSHQQGTSINIGGSISGLNFGSMNGNNINNLNLYTSMTPFSSSQASSSSSSSPYSTSPSTRSVLSQSLPTVISNSNNNHHHSNSNSSNNKIQQKLIHEQFKYVGTFFDFHLQDSYYKYICCGNSSNPLPNEIQSKIRDPENQIKHFHSNKHLLSKVKSIRIRILKVLNSSCAALGGLELWGKPSLSCSTETVQFIYNNNLNNQKFNNSNNSNNQSNLFNNNYFTQQNNQLQNKPSPTTTTTTSIPSLPFNQQYQQQQQQQQPQPQPQHIDLDETMSDSENDSDEDFKRNNPEIVFNEAGLPTNFLDPITLEMMTDPVILPSGVVVDRSTIEKHFQNHYFSDPYSGERISPSDIQTHHVLCAKIQQYKDRGKRKRILKSNSTIFKNQLQLNMLPQISQQLNNNNNNNNSNNNNNNNNNLNVNNDNNRNNLFLNINSNNNNNGISNNSNNNNNNNNNNNSLGSWNNPISINEDDQQPTNSQRPSLTKIVSQDSFVELPIKKHRK